MKLLVTGGLGFIGSNFIRYWLNKYPNDEVLNLDKATYASNFKSTLDLESRSNYSFVRGDICDEKLVDQLMSQNIDIVVHFAAESHVDRSIDDPSIFIKTNVLGTHVLLSAATKYNIKRFHHISTDEVFGSIGIDSDDQFNEETNYDPSSPYSASKASSDMLVQAFGKTYGLPITISNCSNNYGPYQHPEKLIPRAISNLIANSKVPVYGKGRNFRDWLYVEDHCEAIDLIIQKGKLGEKYCIGGLVGGVRNIDLVKTLLKAFGKDESSIEYVADRPAHDNYSVSWKKISEELGWKPKHTLETGLVATIEWYKNNQVWWEETKKEAEEFYKKLGQKSY